MQTRTATIASSSTANTSSNSRRTSMVRPAVNEQRRQEQRQEDVGADLELVEAGEDVADRARSCGRCAMIQVPRKPRPMPAIASSTVCGRRRRSASGTSRLTSVSTIAMASRAWIDLLNALTEATFARDELTLRDRPVSL